MAENAEHFPLASNDQEVEVPVEGNEIELDENLSDEGDSISSGIEADYANIDEPITVEDEPITVEDEPVEAADPVLFKVEREGSL